MIRNRHLNIFIVAMALVSFCGCEAVQRKFVRKKKKEEMISAIVKTKDYSKDLRVDELYKKHFLYWKVWQTELIDRLDATLKKRESCYLYTLSSLDEMVKYLSGAKKEELKGIVNEIKSIEGLVYKKNLLGMEKYKIKNVLEKTKRTIYKNFSFDDVKDYLEVKEVYAD
ncbi:MAG: hypothetical protein ABIG92_07335 [Candidatus Omnitrophota bacterium]